MHSWIILEKNLTGWKSVSSIYHLTETLHWKTKKTKIFSNPSKSGTTHDGDCFYFENTLSKNNIQDLAKIINNEKEKNERIFDIVKFYLII